MHRLLMGDVGTGKTVVALFAMLLAVENDYQAAIMAPTELLAEQHVATSHACWSRSPSTRPGWSGARVGGESRSARAQRRSGASRVVVGTHALSRRRCRSTASGPWP